MMTDCGQSHRRNAAALTTIRITTKLTWRDLRLQVCGDCLRCSRKNTGSGAGRRCKHLSNKRFLHIQNGIFITKSQKIRNDERSLFRSKNLRTAGSTLGREKAKPYFVDLREAAPELKKLLQITRPGSNVAGDSGMDRDFRSGNVFEDSLIGCGFTPFVMVGLESVNRDNDVQMGKLVPISGITRKALVTICVWILRASNCGSSNSTSR